MAVWRNFVCALAILYLQFGGTFVGGASKVSHIPVLVALTEGESITYEYDCEQTERAALCYYIENSTMSYPEMVHDDEDNLPDGMSLVQQECPLYNVTSAEINASLSVWGLLLFYSPDGRCGIEKSADPRPLQVIVDEATKEVPANDVPLIVTTERGQVLNYSCPCEPSVVICVRHEREEPQVLTPHLMESVAIEDHKCGDESSDWAPSAMITSSEETEGVTFFCSHKSDECNIRLSIGPQPMRTLMAVGVNDSCVSGMKEDSVVAVAIAVTLGAVLCIILIANVVMVALWCRSRKSPN